MGGGPERETNVRVGGQSRHDREGPHDQVLKHRHPEHSGRVLGKPFLLARLRSRWPLATYLQDVPGSVSHAVKRTQVAFWTLTEITCSKRHAYESEGGIGRFQWTAPRHCEGEIASLAG